ncbi:MAG: hypothetical protein R2728_16875, partial [Chitinophagales bacterium]
MKNVNYLYLFAFLLGIVACQDHPTKNSDVIIAITDVNIIDMVDGTITRDVTLIIKGKTISEIGASDGLNIPKSAKRVSGSGKYVIPGLWDMHAHTSSDFNTRNVIYPTFIANGITGVRV